MLHRKRDQWWRESLSNRPACSHCSCSLLLPCGMSVCHPFLHFNLFSKLNVMFSFIGNVALPLLLSKLRVVYVDLHVLSLFYFFVFQSMGKWHVAMPIEYIILNFPNQSFWSCQFRWKDWYFFYVHDI